MDIKNRISNKDRLTLVYGSVTIGIIDSNYDSLIQGCIGGIVDLIDMPDEFYDSGFCQDEFLALKKEALAEPYAYINKHFTLTRQYKRDSMLPTDKVYLIIKSQLDDKRGDNYFLASEQTSYFKEIHPPVLYSRDYKFFLEHQVFVVQSGIKVELNSRLEAKNFLTFHRKKSKGFSDIDSELDDKLFEVWSKVEKE